MRQGRNEANPDIELAKPDDAHRPAFFASNLIRRNASPEHLSPYIYVVRHSTVLKDFITLRPRNPGALSNERKYGTSEVNAAHETWAFK